MPPSHLFISSLLCLFQPRRSQREHLVECVKALALCHNVTPVVEEMGESGEGGEGEGVNVDEEVVIFQNKNDPQSLRRISYQASSPDEVTCT